MQQAHATFGPAGTSEAFVAAGGRRSAQLPAYLQQLGLQCFEYSCGRGVHLKEETALEIGRQARQHGIGVSIHAPYYINFANPDAQMRAKSRQYLFQCAALAAPLGATRIVFHPGACAKMARAEAQALALAEMRILAQTLLQEYPQLLFCPETMGKRNQLGTVAEVLQLCEVHERLQPTLDFGHINAREGGVLNTAGGYAQVLDYVEAALGLTRARHMHVHFSHIQYGPQGEIRHLRFADTQYGPDFAALAQLFVQRGYAPVCICESDGTQDLDALTMRQLYENAARTAHR